MAVIKCKMCGGDIELSPDKTFGVCECCGSTMTFPKVDDDQRAAAFNRGNYFRRIGEFDKALAVYEHIVEEDNTDAEAHWCCALCRYGIEYVEDPTTHEYLPTCHRASFDNFLEDVDYQAALQYSDGITKRQYEKDAAKIAEVQHGILATCQNEQPFDVFICYKESDENGSRTKDSTLAQEIYYQLTDQGRRVFFARITLEDKVGTEYEPYIFAALNSAKVMVVVGTKPEYFNAVWVKNEWSRFLAMMKKDRSKLLLPCYRDMDPYDLPEALAVLQSYDMSKIGFIQDLTRGISKVLDAGKQPASAPKETVVVQNVANTNVTAQIKRGNMALADGEWEQAKTFFNQALDMDAECAEAYLGLALLEAHCGSLAALQKQQMDKIQAVQGTSIAVPFQNELQNTLNKTGAEYCNKVRELCDLPDMLSDMEKVFSYTNFQMQSALEEKQEAWKEIQKYYTNDRNMSKALRFAKGETAQQCKEYLSGLHKAAEELLKNQKQHEQAEADEKKKLFTTFLSSATERADKILAANREKLEQTYQSAQEEQSKAHTVEDWKDAARQYASLGKYRDAADQYKKCQTAAQAIENQKQKEKKRVQTILAVVVILVCVVCAVVFLFIIPQSKYNKADALYNAGDYAAAQTAFEELNQYKDAEARATDCENARLQQQYDAAQQLYDNKEFADAESAFRTLGDYNDAAQKAVQAAYLQVISEIPDAEDYSDMKSKLANVLKEKGLSDEALTLNPYYVYCEAQEALQAGNEGIAYNLFKQCETSETLDCFTQAKKLEKKLEPQYAELKAMISDNSIKYAEVEKAANALTGYKNADYYKFYIEQCEKLAQSNTLQSIAFAYKDSDTYAIATINKSDSNWDYVEVMHSEKSNGGKLDTDQVSQKLSNFFSKYVLYTENFDQIFDDDRETYKARM